MKSSKYVSKALALILLAELLVLTCLIIPRLRYPRKYSELVEKYSYEYGVPQYIVYSVIKVESDFDRYAVSPKGACGLMQLMPQTYGWLCDLRNSDTKDIFDPEENVECGVYLLSILYKRYGSWDIALCAYNAVIDWEKTDRERVTAIIELKVIPRPDVGFEETRRNPEDSGKNAAG